MRIFVLLLLLTLCSCASKPAENKAQTAGYEFWDHPCLEDELAKCGDEKLPEDPNTKFNEHQSQVFMCRVSALAKCRNSYGRAKP